MRFLLRKTAAGTIRFRLSFRFAKRLSAWPTAIAGNSGFLFLLIRQSRMRLLVKKLPINTSRKASINARPRGRALTQNEVLDLTKALAFGRALRQNEVLQLTKRR